MPNPRMDSLVVEPSLPDGNCSFNAFVLGWCRSDVLSHIDHLKPPKQYPNHLFRDFIKQSAQVLNVGLSWLSVKNKLLILRQMDKVHLQRQMAPVFRHLSVKLARHNPVFRARTEEHLKSAFLDYILPAYKSVSDDIFSRHSFIREKFKELNPLQTKWFSWNWQQAPQKTSQEKIAEANKKLISWWFAEDGGYDYFLKAMEKHGEWAGDIELDLVADFFDVDLDVRRKKFVHHIHFNRGSIEKKYFDEDQIIQLVRRGIVNPGNPDDIDLRFLPLAMQEVEERLDAVPGCEKLRELIWQHSSLKGQPVPIVEGAAIKQLLQRDIIGKQGDRYVFSCDQNVAINLIDKFPGKEKMLHLWKEKYISDKPTIRLENEDATHWDNLLTQLDKENLDRSDVLQYRIALLLAARGLYLALMQYLQRPSDRRINFSHLQLFHHEPVTIASASSRNCSLSL